MKPARSRPQAAPTWWQALQKINTSSAAAAVRQYTARRPDPLVDKRVDLKAACAEAATVMLQGFEKAWSARYIEEFRTARRRAGFGTTHLACSTTSDGLAAIEPRVQQVQGGRGALAYDLSRRPLPLDEDKRLFEDAYNVLFFVKEEGRWKFDGDAQLRFRCGQDQEGALRRGGSGAVAVRNSSPAG